MQEMLAKKTEQDTTLERPGFMLRKGEGAQGNGEGLGLGARAARTRGRGAEVLYRGHKQAWKE